MISYFFLALRNLNRRKLRATLTLVSMIIALATIFVLVSVSLGLQAAVEEQFRLLGTDKFFIQPGGQLAGPGTAAAAQLTLRDVEGIEKTAGVKDVSYYVMSHVRVESDHQAHVIHAFGFPFEKRELFLETSGYTLDEGRLFKESNTGKIAVGSQYKDALVFGKAVKVHDTIHVNGQRFKISAVMHPKGNPLDDRAILMLDDDFKQLFPNRTTIDQIIVQMNPGSNLEEVAKKVDKRLQTIRGVDEKSKDFVILKPQELLFTLNTILAIITAFLVGIAAISLLVGGIGIANTMFTSVLERTREIGVMKAVGARNRDILLLFLIESGMLGFVGGILGVLCGIGIATTIEYIAEVQLSTTLLQAAMPWYLIAWCLLFSFVVGAFSGLWPAWRASRLKAVDALRYE